MTVSLNSLKMCVIHLKKKKKKHYHYGQLPLCMPSWLSLMGMELIIVWNDSHDYAEHWFCNWNCPFIWSCKAMKLWVSNKPNENWNRLGCLDNELFVWPFLVITLLNIITSICSARTGIWCGVLTVYKFNIVGHFAGMTGLQRRVSEQDTSCGQWLLMV